MSRWKTNCLIIFSSPSPYPCPTTIIISPPLFLLFLAGLSNDTIARGAGFRHRPTSSTTRNSRRGHCVWNCNWSSSLSFFSFILFYSLDPVLPRCVLNKILIIIFNKKRQWNVFVRVEHARCTTIAVIRVEAGSRARRFSCLSYSPHLVITRKIWPSDYRRISILLGGIYRADSYTGRYTVFISIMSVPRCTFFLTKSLKNYFIQIK